MGFSQIQDRSAIQAATSGRIGKPSGLVREAPSVQPVCTEKNNLAETRVAEYTVTSEMSGNTSVSWRCLKMTQVTVELPDEAMTALRDDPEHLRNDVKLAAAVTWYQEGRVSQEVAARIAGLDRTDFLLTLARLGRNSFVVEVDDLERELSRG